MPFTLGSSDGLLNGTTPVTIVSAPASGAVRTIRLVNIYNADTASVTVTMRLNNNGTARVLAKATLAAGETFIYEHPIVLDATTKTLQAVLAAAPASSQPVYYCAYGDS